MLNLYWGGFHGHVGDATAGVEYLREAATLPAYQDPARQVMLAWWLAKYGEVDAALAIITHAYVDQDYLNPSWLWFPVFTQVRQRPGFAAILKHTGLLNYWSSRENWGDFCAPDADGKIRCR